MILSRRGLFGAIFGAGSTPVERVSWDDAFDKCIDDLAYLCSVPVELRNRDISINEQARRIGYLLFHSEDK